MAPVLVVVIAILLVALVIWLVRRREPDTLDSFRRQIDALSPEARRPVVDQVQQLEEQDDVAGDAGDLEGDGGGAADGEHAGDDDTNGDARGA